MKKRIVVVGLGSIGRRHARLLAERGDLDVAWCEVSPAMEQLARTEMSAPRQIYRDFAEAISSAPDYVLIATPQNHHCHQAISALNAGIPVLCEKPLSDNLADAKKIAACVMETGVPLAVGFQSHFSDPHIRLREIVRSGAIGQIRHFHCRVGTYLTLQNSRSRYQSQMFGALIQDYSHQPDLAFWILGEIPTAAHARGLTSRRPELWAEPNVLSVDSIYEGDTLGTLHLNYLQMPQRHHYEIVGDDGWVFLDADTGQLQIGDRKTNRVSREDHAVERDLLYRLEHEAFFDAAAGKRPPESSAADGLVSAAFADATLTSLQTGEPAALESLDPEDSGTRRRLNISSMKIS